MSRSPRLLSLFGLLFAASLGTEATASQVHMQALPLKDVVSSSRAVVIVRSVDVPNDVVSIAVSEDPEVPSFTFSLRHFEVVEVLRSPGDAISKDQRIRVGPADLEDRMSLHQRYYVDGISKSPIYFSYEGSLSKGADPAQRVLFLRPCSLAGQSYWCPTASGAEESTDRLPEIRPLLDQGKPQ